MKLRSIEIEKCRIEMMPLIDSFFLILVYFIYAFLSMSVHKGIDLKLPQASAAVEQKKDYYAVSVDKDGQIFFNKELVGRDELSGRLKELTAQAKEFNLFIFGDTDAHHWDVIFVLNTAKEAGIDQVSIETNILNDENE